MQFKNQIAKKCIKDTNNEINYVTWFRKPEFNFQSKIEMANKRIHISLSQPAIYFILDMCCMKVGRNGYNL